MKTLLIGLALLGTIAQIQVTPPPRSGEAATESRGGTISGRILDPQGRPSAIASVTAARLTYQEGRPMLVPRKTATTDDRGEYRLFWLEPGEYFVRAEKNLVTGPARSYFPGTESAVLATRVVVAEGTETAKTDFMLRDIAVVTVSGVVISVVPGFESPAPVPAGQIAAESVRAAREAEAAQAGRAQQFYLSPADPGGIYDGSIAVSNSVTSTQDRAAGKFELRNIRSGAYELYAVIQDRAVAPVRYYMAHTSIDVSLQDVSGVMLTITPGVDLNGRVVYSANASPAAGPVRVQLRPKDVLPDPAIAAGLSAVVSEDGTFTIANVPDLRYSVVVSPLNPNTYIADIRQGTRTVFEQGTVSVLRPPQDTLEVMVAAPAGAISGTVSAVPEPLTGGVTVTLVPEEPRWQNTALYKRALTTSGGNFSFANVTPGSYRLFAWEAIPDGAEQNAEFIRSYWELGTEIAVPAGNTSAAPLRLISK